MNVDKVSILIFLISIRLFSDIINIPILEPIITSILLLYVSYLLIENSVKLSVINLILFLVLLFSLINGLLYTLQYEYSFLEPLRSLIRWMTILGLFFIPKCISIDKEKLFNKIFNIIIIPGFILIIFSIYIGGYKEYQGQLRLSEPFNNPNSLALFCFISILILFIQFTFIKKNYLILISFVYLYALLKSGGITSTLSTIIFIFNASLLFVERKNKILILTLIPILFCVMFYFSYDIIYSRLNNVVFSDINNLTFSEGSSVYWRFTAWSLYLSSMSSFDYFYGHGLGVSRFLLNPNSYISQYNKFSAPGTHNDYIQIIIDFGFIGLSLFFFFQYQFVMRLYKTSFFEKDNKIIIAFSLSLLLYMTMDNVLDTKFFFLIILIFSTYINKKNVKG
ncbi:TPA: O-antigen ligase family protein [Photobacterium damselae]